ncbi:MAG: tRNA (adenosine(37)-N6)-dimethylallyltransferase MiaA [Chitinispirillaceae bacterium]|nr:tRNA (adenosine(37)-N6)-dimethylallyltransferase MiaA [Chitinispirillaceae bacterium]
MENLIIKGMNEKFNLLVICGPTASGKTSLAVEIAAKLNGEIISADSRQVYKGLDIGSGKDLFEYNKNGISITYHLIDIADPKEIYTLYHYQRDFYKVFENIKRRGKLPIMCGGSGLYIEAIVKGYKIPTVPEDKELRNKLMREDHQKLKEMLYNLNPKVYEKTDLSSKKRVVRGIEIALSYTKIDKSEREYFLPHISPLIICIRLDRKELWKRIDRRLEKRLSEGMVEEVKRLRESGVPDERLFMLGMEYKYITLYLRQEISYEEMVKKLRTAIHQLAKRQDTYFRGMERRGCKIHWISEPSFKKAMDIISSCLITLSN